MGLIHAIYQFSSKQVSQVRSRTQVTIHPPSAHISDVVCGGGGQVTVIQGCRKGPSTPPLLRFVSSPQSSPLHIFIIPTKQENAPSIINTGRTAAPLRPSHSFFLLLFSRKGRGGCSVSFVVEKLRRETRELCLILLTDWISDFIVLSHMFLLYHLDVRLYHYYFRILQSFYVHFQYAMLFQKVFYVIPSSVLLLSSTNSVIL